MNKQFMYINGTIVVSDENGMKPAIPYVDNIEDMLILQNEIDFLETQLEVDKKDLKTKKEEIAYRNKDSKMISTWGSLLAVGATFGISSFMGLSHEEMTNTILGPMSEYLAFSIPMSVGCVGFVQMVSLLGLSYRPSKKSIIGLEEKISCAEEMMKTLKSELTYLEDNATSDRYANVEEMISYYVNSNSSIELLKEILKLRYSFGYDSEYFYKLLVNGSLEEKLIAEGFSDIAIMDFSEYVAKKMKEKTKSKHVNK